LGKKISELPDLDNSLLEDFTKFEKEILSLSVKTGEENSRSYSIPELEIKFRKSALFNFWKLARFLRKEGKI